MARAQVLPVCIISGDELFLVRRFRDGYIGAMLEQGWSVEYADAGTPGEVSAAMGGGLFVEDMKTLVVVMNPHQGDLALYDTHIKAKNPDTVLALYYEGKPHGNTKWGKFVKAHPKIHRAYDRPKDWDLPEYARAFLLEEAQDQGLQFEHPGLPAAIVERAGTDLGVLHFEIRKMAALAESGTITVEVVKGALAELTTASVLPVIDALSVRNRRKLAKALGRIEATHRSDATMAVCRIVGARAVQWLQAANLAELPAAAAAEELGLNPWHYKNNILPVARKWGQNRLIKLIKTLARCERSVLSGEVSPWSFLCARLLRAC